MAHDLGQIVVAAPRVGEICENANAQIAIRKIVDANRATRKALIIGKLETSAICALEMPADCSPVAIARVTASKEAHAVGRGAYRHAVLNLIATSDLNLRARQASRCSIDRDPVARHRARDALRSNGCWP